MTSHPARRLALAISLLALSALAPPASARSKTKIAIEPGPTAMSEAEKEIEADPGRGIEHAVVLIEEGEKNEESGWQSEIAYHMRAKILSNEGRDLANIEIPFNVDAGELRHWWGRTIHADGSVYELPIEQLREQRVEKIGSWQVTHLKAALPRVVPGCVIDYGYAFRGRAVVESIRIPLQRRWPVRQFRYRWIPFPWRPASFWIGRGEGLAISARHDSRSILVEAQEIPAAVEEPLMPPDGETRASVTFYYIEPGRDEADFWNSEARRIERFAAWFVPGKTAQQAILREMGIPAEGSLADRLRAAYAWIQSRVRNTSLRTIEEIESGQPPGPPRRTTPKAIMKSGRASGVELDFLFLAVARALGAEAQILKAPDRTRSFWDGGLRSTRQLPGTLVAVRAAGEPVEDSTIVDPGSGLPYGEVPWWFTGTHAMVATSKGLRTLLVPPAPASRNLSETRITMEFPADNAPVAVRWTRRTMGQQGYLEKRVLRTLSPQDRQRRLETYCGAAGGFDVVRTEAQDLELLDARFSVACEGRWSVMPADPSARAYSLELQGAWIETVPELNASSRTHPVIFNFPRSERQTLEVSAPGGFEAVAGQDPVVIENQFGAYRLEVATMSGGYRVERSFALHPLRVEPEEYPELRSFLLDVRYADRTTLEFRRSGEGG